MNSAVNWKDNYTITNDRILFTDEELHVPGLRVLARHTLSGMALSRKRL